MGDPYRIGHAAYQGPSIVKETIYALTAGLLAGGLWKIHQWKVQKRS